METWFVSIISLCIVALIKTFINLLYPKPRLPPGPFTFPILGNFLLHRKSPLELRYLIRALQPKYGPVITLHINSSPSIFIFDRSLAHQVLIQAGAVFSNRPPPSFTRRITTSNPQSINSAAYGPTWRLLRRNLMVEILHPLRLKSYSNARKRVLQNLQDCFNSQSKTGDPVRRLIDHFRYAIFSLLVFLCFGDKLDQKKIKELEGVQRFAQMDSKRFNIIDFWPRLAKIVLRKQYEEFLRTRQRQEDVFMPLIEERKQLKEERSRKAKHEVKEVDDDYVLAYVDTLFDLQLPEEKRKLNEKEIMSLCSEFLNAGTITTATALQWVMANLVKYPQIQEKLFTEIKGVVGDAEREVKEDDLQKMPYLKAVILETLRRHPPARFAVPHAVKEEVVLNGFLFPKNASINFMIADMGWDSKVWDDPMAFKPERFLKIEGNRGEVFDITGSREIKMMPFGVGRRICPGLGLAMLHLEYFVANFIWLYEWKAVNGDEVSLEEKLEVMMVMKYPLQAHINLRSP